MYIKWIICTVKNNQKQAFSKAQENWSLTANSDGFIGQIGGWNVKNLNEACILSVWENKESLDAFMRNIHDKIISSNNQIDTYKSITIQHLNSIKNSIKLTKTDVQNSKLLAVIEFNENPTKIDYHEEIKNYGVTNGSLYSNFSKNKNSYLIASLWNNKEEYFNKKFEKIASNYNQPLNIKIIELVASWKIIKKPY